jgi:hypothetical protein
MVDAALHLLECVGLTAIAVNLGPAGDAGRHTMAIRIAGNHSAPSCARACGRGPTSDISLFQNVEQLRQLVEAGAPTATPRIRQSRAGG